MAVNKGGCHRQAVLLGFNPALSLCTRTHSRYQPGGGDNPGWGHSHPTFRLCLLEEKWTSLLVLLFSVWERTQLARRQGTWNFCEGGLWHRETVLKFVTPNPSNSLLTIPRRHSWLRWKGGVEFQRDGLLPRWEAVFLRSYFNIADG